MSSAIAQQPEPHGFREGIRLLARLSRVAETSFQESGISLPQYRLLVAVASRSQRAGEVAERLGVTRPTLSSLVDTLERGGLLRRVPVSSDRRGIRLEPTTAGRQALDRAERELSERLSRLVGRHEAAAAWGLVSSLAAALDRA